MNVLYLIPKFLAKRQYIPYGILTIMNLGLWSFFNIILFEDLIDYLLPGYYFISYYEFLDILKFTISFIIISTLLKLSKSWFQMLEAENRIVRLESENISSELKALKLQINPHFLFNSLNNIYSLARKSSPKTGDSILILSDMMRYVLYETKSDFVKLSDEIQFFKNFVELQKLRIDEHSKIELKVDLDNNKLEIAPMILMPFFENSFKHGVKGDVGQTFAKFELKTSKNQLSFSAENNKGESNENRDGHGIGIENVKRRLDILYPDKYDLKIEEEDTLFKVNLKLTLKE
jgi:LytS/YehU family sensor histidine kinase